MLESFEQTRIGCRIEQVSRQSLTAPTHALHVHVVGYVRVGGDVRLKDRDMAKREMNENTTLEQCETHLHPTIGGKRKEEWKKRE